MKTGLLISFLVEFAILFHLEEDLEEKILIGIKMNTTHLIELFGMQEKNINGIELLDVKLYIIHLYLIHLYIDLKNLMHSTGLKIIII